jgi:hypothetical protein
VCLGSDEGAEKRKKGRRVKRRGKGGGSGQGHAEKEEGGGGRHRGSARHGCDGSGLLQQWWAAHASQRSGSGLRTGAAMGTGDSRAGS